jgi:uroporphyrinogen III methyltransferase/synthase
VKTYPLCLVHLEEQPMIVIGGGKVAARKAAALLQAGAKLKVVSPEFAEEFDLLAERYPQMILLRRPYQDGDLQGVFLAIAATDDAQVNQAIWQEALRRGCLVNVVDDPQHSNFIAPAVVERGEVKIAVSTGGSSPALARRLKERLAQAIGPEYGELAELMAELRPELMERFAAGEPRLEAALRLVDADLLELLRQQGYAAARRRAREMIASKRSDGEATSPTSGATAPDRPIAQSPNRPSSISEAASEATTKGVVYLVGAGPGDAGLITVRGVACLREAQVVVHDRLVSRALRRYAPAAEWIDVGKSPDHHPVPQEQINALLVERASVGQVVVRLKGGDPFVFGRGGEEAQALAAADIPFEVVPGVTSAIAVPAYAGIPVTQRGLTTSLAVITGHRSRDIEDGVATLDCAALGAGTRVFLMGVKELPRLVARLLESGCPPDTPAAVIEQGTTPRQKVRSGTLGDIVERAADIRPPAITVVGQVVALRQQLAWFDDPRRRPLLGMSILNTRPAESSDDFRMGGESTAISGATMPKYSHSEATQTRKGDFGQCLAALGAEVWEMPVTRLAAMPAGSDLHRAIARLAQASEKRNPLEKPAWDWIVFTSANAVRFFFECVYAGGWDARILAGVRLGAVGPATAQALAAQRLRVDFMPQRYRGLDWAAQAPDLEGKRLLLPRSELALPDLVQALEQRGAKVEAITAYSVEHAPPDPEAMQALLEGKVDVVTFFSPSALHGLVAAIGKAIGSRESEDPTAIGFSDSAQAPKRSDIEILNRQAVACVGTTTAEAARQLGLRVDVVAKNFTVDGLVKALVEWRMHW